VYNFFRGEGYFPVLPVNTSNALDRETYEATNFSNRKALEESIVSASGRTVDKKDAQITGSVVELKELRLSHGQTIWGVQVVASDYQVNNNPRVKRGKRLPTKLNGV
jgi:hypothetical protein